MPTEDAMAEFARSEVAGRDWQDGSDFPHALWRAMGGAGLFRIGLPETHGGSGGDHRLIAAAERALLEHGGVPGLAMCWAAHQMIARHFLAAHGSPGQQARYLPELASGRLTASVAISEPRVGAHPKLLTTSATRVAAGYVLRGEKSYATNGPIAGLFVVLAATGAVAGRKRYSCLLVPRDAPGLEIIPAATPRALHPAGHCGLRLHDVVVPAEALLGVEGTAYEAMALPLRDGEDAVSCVGLAATLGLLVRCAGACLGAEMSVEDSTALGRLSGLATVACMAAMAAPAALDAGTLGAAEAQAVMIGVREVAGTVADGAEALVGEGAGPGVSRLLTVVRAQLQVARSARNARMARLGAGLGKPGAGASR